MFTEDEQKVSTLDRQLCGIISTLQIYDYFIIGSPYPIKIFCDHKPLLYLWARKERLSDRFFRYQVITTQLTILQIIRIPGKNLGLPILLSRNVALKDLDGHQLAHKEIPKDIRFFNQNGHEVQNLIDHNTSADDENDDFYLIFCSHLGETKALHLQDDGTELICTLFESKSPKALVNVFDSFRESKNVNNRRKWQAAPMVVEAEFHEKYYSEIETDSEISDNEASDEDLALNQEIEDSQETYLNSTPSIFLVHEPNKTLKLTTDTFGCDNILVKHENDSVFKTVRSWISKRRPQKT